MIPGNNKDSVFIETYVRVEFLVLKPNMLSKNEVNKAKVA